jgi:hypothetical protein
LLQLHPDTASTIRSSAPSRSTRCRGTSTICKPAAPGAGAILRQDLAFLLCGPMDEPLMGGELAFWREAPRVGLTGIARIKFVAAGVIAEDVAYDLNLASDLLRQADVGQRDECRFPAG